MKFNFSHINIRYYLELQIPKGHRKLLLKIHKIVNIYNLFAMIEEIHFILHVVIGN